MHIPKILTNFAAQSERYSYMSATSLEHLDGYIANAMTRADQLWLLNRISSRLMSSVSMSPYTIEELDKELDAAEEQFANQEYLTAAESDRLMSAHIGQYFAQAI